MNVPVGVFLCGKADDVKLPSPIMKPSFGCAISSAAALLGQPQDMPLLYFCLVAKSPTARFFSRFSPVRRPPPKLNTPVFSHVHSCVRVVQLCGCRSRSEILQVVIRRPKKFPVQNIVRGAAPQCRCHGVAVAPPFVPLSRAVSWLPTYRRPIPHPQHAKRKTRRCKIQRLRHPPRTGRRDRRKAAS